MVYNIKRARMTIVLVAFCEDKFSIVRQRDNISERSCLPRHERFLAGHEFFPPKKNTPTPSDREHESQWDAAMIWIIGRYSNSTAMYQSRDVHTSD
eukprot:scaffold14974_cov195-Amphora_coffeaeformis.AAC.4